MDARVAAVHADHLHDGCKQARDWPYGNNVHDTERALVDFLTQHRGLLQDHPLWINVYRYGGLS